MTPSDIQFRYLTLQRRGRRTILTAVYGTPEEADYRLVLEGDTIHGWHGDQYAAEYQATKQVIDTLRPLIPQHAFDPDIGTYHVSRRDVALRSRDGVQCLETMARDALRQERETREGSGQ